jgi:hypothetical protein
MSKDVHTYLTELEKKCEELQEQLTNELTTQHIYTPKWVNGSYTFMDINLAQIYKSGDDYNIIYGIPVKASDTKTGIMNASGGTKGKSLTQCKEHVEKVMLNLIKRKLHLE